MRKLLIALLVLVAAAGTAHAGRKAPAKKLEPKEQAVSFKTADGWTLRGSFFPAGPAAPAVLLMHKLGTNRAEFIGLAKLLQEKGMNALAYDGRGHGASTMRDGKQATFESFTAREFEGMTADIDAALKFLRAEKKIKDGPVGLVGASIQSSTGLVYASEHPRVKAVVMLSPGLDYHGIDVLAPMKLYGERAVYLVSSIEDAPSYKAAKALEELARGPKKKETLSDAGHGAEMFRKDPRLEERIAAWLKERLR